MRPPPRPDSHLAPARPYRLILAAARAVLSLPRRLIVFLLGLYKAALSPLLPAACRHQPTCSEYCREAVERHGVLKGLWLGLKRLCRCHPFSKGGFDPVP